MPKRRVTETESAVEAAEAAADDHTTGHTTASTGDGAGDGLTEVVVSGPTQVAAAELAWSDYGPDEDEDASWRSAFGSAAPILFTLAVVAVVAAVGGWIWLQNRPQHDAPPSPTAAVPDTMPAAAPRIASTVTVPVAPTTVVQAAAIRTALPACYHSDPAEEEPTTSSTWCRHHWYENLTWTSWKSTSADGTGIQILQNCTPSCAQGQLWRTPVEVHFSDSEPAPADSECPTDMRYYTQLIVAYPTTPPPPDLAVPYQGGPVYMLHNGMPAYRWNSLTPRCHASDN